MTPSDAPARAPVIGSPARVRAYLAIAAALTALWPACASLVSYWRHSSDYQHGFVITMVSLGWLYSVRLRLDAVEYGASLPAAAVLVALLLAWTIGWRAGVADVSQTLVPAVALAAVWAIAGRAAATVVLLPIGYLYFAIPVWDHLVPVLQAMTVWATEHLLDALGVPAVVEGSRVTIPEGQFMIIEDCAGKRTLTMGLAVAVLAGALAGVRGRRRLALIGTAAALVVVTNWLRVAIVIEAGHLSHMGHYFVAVEHFSLGWVLFALDVALIALLARRWMTEPAPPPPVGVAPVRAQAAGPWLAWASIAIVGALTVATLRLAPGIAAPALDAAPAPFAGSEARAPDVGWMPRYAGAAAEFRAARGAPGDRLEAYVNVFGPQRPGHKLVQFDHTLLGPGWQLVESGAPGAGALEWDAPGLSVARDANQARWVIIYRYRVGRFATSSAGVAQLLYGAQALFEDVPAGMAALAARCTTDCEQERARVWDAARIGLPSLDRMIPRQFSRLPQATP